MTCNNSQENLISLKNKGNEHFKEKEYNKAIIFFTQYIVIDGKDHVIYSNRSAAYALLGDFENALKDAEKCIQLKPDWPKGYSRKGLALFNLSLTDESEKAYEHGLKLDPSNESLKAGLENVRNSKNNYSDIMLKSTITRTIANTSSLQQYAADDDYISELTKAVKQIQANPNSLKLYLNQPDVRMKEGLMTVLGLASEMEVDPELAKVKIKKEAEEAKIKRDKIQHELNKTPQQIEGDEWKKKGNEFYKKRLFDEALEAYKKAIQINPNELTYNNNIAALYLEKGEHALCLEECEKAIERRYDIRADYIIIAKLYSRMGSCYMKEKKYENATKMFEKSLLEDNNRYVRTSLKDAQNLLIKFHADAYIDPNLAEIHRENGNALFKCGDYPGAKKEYDIAIRRNPADPKLYSNRAAALMKLLEFPSALIDIEKCLKLDPLFVKGWVRKGRLHASLKEYNKSLHAIENGLKIDPTNAECRQAKMEVLEKTYQTSRSGNVDEEQVRHAMADPEVKQIVSDPQFAFILKKINEDPSSLHEYMKDPKIAEGITKLMMAGIIKIG